ncbi:pyridoxal phosphate-dependent aminotransferase [Anoxybacterium hadale]|uniref:Pyridoxal phosphate-dependent aminotransferase n=1 Tax=Anoxybacterium hadale TaxID=3408580 RepID=A0ACD1AAQ3_9FIRM|nr:pyridoxal phosphate-dependent aminotransferase [Clostridiales bacterium]
MTYDFDEIIERKGTNCIKYDFACERGKPEGLLPLWVADMDFRTPPEVVEALAKASQHGIFGYSEVKLPYFEAVHNWLTEHIGWETEEGWLVKTPGVVFAISTAIRALTETGDSILIQRPVYYPFTHVILDNDRKLVNNPLVYENGRYEIDFEDFESKIKENDVKLFVLCNPHNPVGRVWTKEELIRMGEICVRHQVTVVSDEIHADFIYPGHQHLVFSSLKPEFADLTITCTAPSKTFNLAGLQVSNIFISNKGLRREFRKEIGRTGYGQLNTMGLIACQAAYEKGALWLQELKEYLIGNLSFIREFLNRELPEVVLVEPEGTYLVWLDFQKLGLTEKELEHLIVDKAKLWLDEGTMFGPEGDGFQRFNIACPRATLEAAFHQLKNAIRNE